MKTALVAIAAASLLSACGQEKPQFYSIAVRCEITTNKTIANEVQKPETKTITVNFGLRSGYVDGKAVKSVPFVYADNMLYKDDKDGDTARMKTTASVNKINVYGTAEFIDDNGGRSSYIVDLDRDSGVITMIRESNHRPTKNPSNWYFAKAVTTGTCVKPSAI